VSCGRRRNAGASWRACMRWCVLVHRGAKEEQERGSGGASFLLVVVGCQGASAAETDGGGRHRANWAILVSSQDSWGMWCLKSLTLLDSAPKVFDEMAARIWTSIFFLNIQLY
jgi:hypothetical protein